MALRAHPLLCGAILLPTLLACASSPASAPSSRSGSDRPLRKAFLEPLAFEAESPKRPEAIELCLPPKLRQRQWNVEDHPFRVDLGSVTAREFEQLVKAFFANVTVTFERQCGARTGLPWITTEIYAANRERYSEVEDDLQYTAITLVTSVHGARDQPVWIETTESVVSAPPVRGGFGGSGQRSGLLSLLFPHTIAVKDLRHAQASRAFGRAIEEGIREVERAMRRADELPALLSPVPGADGGPEA